MSIRTSVSDVPGRNAGRLVKRYQRVPGVPMLYDWTVFSFFRGVIIGSPNSEYLWMEFRSRRTARDYIKKERRNGN